MSSCDPQTDAVSRRLTTSFRGAKGDQPKPDSIAPTSIVEPLSPSIVRLKNPAKVGDPNVR